MHNYYALPIFYSCVSKCLLTEVTGLEYPFNSDLHNENSHYQAPATRIRLAVSHGNSDLCNLAVSFAFELKTPLNVMVVSMYWCVLVKQCLASSSQWITSVYIPHVESVFDGVPK